MEIKKVGVVGCGVMGAGITQVCAQSGYQVVVSEVKDEFLNKGLASINTILSKSVEKGKLSQQDKDAVPSGYGGKKKAPGRADQNGKKRRGGRDTHFHDPGSIRREGGNEDHGSGNAFPGL